MERLISIVIGYIFGLIQSGYLYGKANHMDIRQYGSGNAGSTNVLRVMGKKAGAIVFLGDFFKAVFAMAVCRLLFKGNADVDLLALYAGLGVTLGHNFPFFLKFKGGKGIAASGGMIVGLWDWRLVVILLAAFVISVVITRYVSVGSLTIMIGFFILYTVFAIHGDYNFTSNAKMIEGIIMAGIIAGMAVIRHWQNIKRLIAGTENKLSFGSKKA